MQGRRRQQHAGGRASSADASSISLQTILRQARKSGQLNLSSRSFTEGSSLFGAYSVTFCKHRQNTRCIKSFPVQKWLLRIFYRRVYTKMQPAGRRYTLCYDMGSKNAVKTTVKLQNRI